MSRCFSSVSKSLLLQSSLYQTHIYFALSGCGYHFSIKFASYSNLFQKFVVIVVASHANYIRDWCFTNDYLSFCVQAGINQNKTTAWGIIEVLVRLDLFGDVIRSRSKSKTHWDEKA